MQSTSSTIPSAQVLSAQDYIKACEQPVAIGTAISMLVMLPINAVGMFTLFTKVDKMFNPSRLMAEQRARK